MKDAIDEHVQTAKHTWDNTFHTCIIPSFSQNGACMKVTGIDISECNHRDILAEEPMCDHIPTEVRMTLLSPRSEANKHAEPRLDNNNVRLIGVGLEELGVEEFVKLEFFKGGWQYFILISIDIHVYLYLNFPLNIGLTTFM